MKSLLIKQHGFIGFQQPCGYKSSVHQLLGILSDGLSFLNYSSYIRIVKNTFQASGIATNYLVVSLWGSLSWHFLMFSPSSSFFSSIYISLWQLLVRFRLLHQSANHIMDQCCWVDFTYAIESSQWVPSESYWFKLLNFWLMFRHWNHIHL